VLYWHQWKLRKDLRRNPGASPFYARLIWITHPICPRVLCNATARAYIPDYLMLFERCDIQDFDRINVALEDEDENTELL
jgi:hypothetical protein